MTVNELAELLTPIGWGPLASRTPDQQCCTLNWGFHTVWGGIDPWDLGPRFVGIVEI